MDGSNMLIIASFILIVVVVGLGVAAYFYLKKTLYSPISIIKPIKPPIPLILILEEHAKKLRLMTLPEILTPIHSASSGTCNYFSVEDDTTGFACPTASETPEKVITADAETDPLGWLQEYVLRFPLYDLGFVKTGTMDLFFVPWNPDDVLNPPNNLGSNFAMALSIIGGSIGRQKVRSPVLASSLIYEITNTQQAVETFGPGWVCDTGGAVYKVAPFSQTIDEQNLNKKLINDALVVVLGPQNPAYAKTNGWILASYDVMYFNEGSGIPDCFYNCKVGGINNGSGVIYFDQIRTQLGLPTSKEN